ncbi:glycosyltransferase family 2 protein, partial [Vibrio sp. 10N.222.49.F1]
MKTSFRNEIPLSNLPLISIVMAVYNCEKYLKYSIDSIIEQSYENFEFIIVDDCSVDNSLSIINSYKDSRLRIIKNDENMGLAGSLNRAIEEAAGKYIARMDADDISLSNRIEKQVSYMEQHKNVAVCGTNIQHIDSNNNPIKDRIKWIKEDNRSIKNALIYGSCFAHPSVIVRAKYFREHSIRYEVTLRRSQDYDLWFKLSEYGDFANLNEPLLLYRISGDMASIKHSVDQKLSKNTVRNKYVNRFIRYS